MLKEFSEMSYDFTMTSLLKQWENFDPDKLYVNRNVIGALIFIVRPGFHKANFDHNND